MQVANSARHEKKRSRAFSGVSSSGILSAQNRGRSLEAGVVGAVIVIAHHESGAALRSVIRSPTMVPSGLWASLTTTSFRATHLRGCGSAGTPASRSAARRRV